MPFASYRRTSMIAKPNYAYAHRIPYIALIEASREVFARQHTFIRISNGAILRNGDTDTRPFGEIEPLAAASVFAKEHIRGRTAFTRLDISPILADGRHYESFSAPYELPVPSRKSNSPRGRPPTRESRKRRVDVTPPRPQSAGVPP